MVLVNLKLILIKTYLSSVLHNEFTDLFFSNEKSENGERFLPICFVRSIFFPLRCFKVSYIESSHCVIERSEDIYIGQVDFFCFFFQEKCLSSFTPNLIFCGLISF